MGAEAEPPTDEPNAVVRREELAPADYCDPVIEAYKKNVDRALLRENLKLTVEERFLKAQRLHESIEGREAITEALHLIFQGIDRLTAVFPNRAFTIDGRLVGDIGEVIAALEYDVVLHKVSQPGHDATTPDGRNVQIKATFKDSLTFKTIPDYYLGFKLYPDGRHEEVFNGPGRLIYDRYAARKRIGVALLSFPLAELKKLSQSVAPNDRIPRRQG